MKAIFIRSNGNEEVWLITGCGVYEYQYWPVGYRSNEIEDFINN